MLNINIYNIKLNFLIFHKISVYFCGWVFCSALLDTRPCADKQN